MKKLFLLFALCALAMVSCNENETPEPMPTPKVEFDITSNNPVAVAAEGGVIEVTYSIKNGDETLTVAAVCDAEWIEQDAEAATAENTLRFNVEKNEAEETRSAKITLTYGELSKEVVVNQAAATNKHEPENDPVLTITSEATLNYTAEGGQCKITYTVENPKEGVFVESYSDVEWIEQDPTYATEGELYYIVKKNEVEEPRTGKVVITYGELSKEVVVNQEAGEHKEDPSPILPEGTIELEYLSGNYFHYEYSNTPDVFNYSVVISTMDNCLDMVTGEANISANNTYVYLDIFSSVPSENYNISFTLPAGEYTLDSENTASAGTFGAQFSYIYVTGEDTGDEIALTAGKVVVTESSITATLTDIDGNEYNFICYDLEVDNTNRFVGDGYHGDLSTITGDIYMPCQDCDDVEVWNFGDYYWVGKYQWYVNIYDYSRDYYNYDSIELELLVPYEDVRPEGEFEVTSDLSKRQMVLPGFACADGTATWSWFIGPSSQGPIVAGKVNISYENDEIIVDFNLEDDLGNKITGKCQWTYYYWNSYAPSANATRSLVINDRPSRKR